MDKMKGILLGAAGAALSAAAFCEGFSMAIDHSLVCVALDRHEPRMSFRLKSRLKGCADDQHMAELLAAGACSMESLPHQEISISGRDGICLKGHLFSAEECRRVILAMHGWRSGWSRDFCMAADFFQEEHCTVLYAEQRGQGKSGGKYMGFGMIERYDCLEWIRWLNQNGFTSSPLYLAGVSMGATTVLMAGGFAELPSNVAGIMADCGFTSARDEWRHISENNLHMSFDRRQRHLDALCRRRILMDSDAYSSLEAMKNCRIPVLFIHGSEDRFVPVEMTLKNYAACRAPKKLLIVDGASHGMSYVVAPEQYRAAVREFWRECEA